MVVVTVGYRSKTRWPASRNCSYRGHYDVVVEVQSDVVVCSECLGSHNDSFPERCSAGLLAEK